MKKTSEDNILPVAEEIPSPTGHGTTSSAKVIHGRLIPPQQQILLYSADDWETFIQEWVHYQKCIYARVVRFSGANDMGIDVAGFTDGKGFECIWDNYQCKHYATSLTPTIAIPEIGKIIWHAYKGHISPPRKYYFMAPKDCGMSLKKLLLKTEDLKEKLFEKWDDWCANSITSKEKVKIEGDFLDYLEGFDFTIFTYKSALEVIEEHSQTPYHAARFGGGLPDRPAADVPPQDPQTSESRYIAQLFEAYSDNKKRELHDLKDMGLWPDLVQHYHRQREYFYYAESLRNFARDTVPPGTYEELQDEVYAGVADLEASPHPCAFTRLNAVTQAAANLPLTANGLISVTKVQDKRGICHQLANEDRLVWRRA